MGDAELLRDVSGEALRVSRLPRNATVRAAGGPAPDCFPPWECALQIGGAWRGRPARSLLVATATLLSFLIIGMGGRSTLVKFAGDADASSSGVGVVGPAGSITTKRREDGQATRLQLQIAN